MKFYILPRLKDDLDYDQFGHYGTWTDGVLCKGCGYSTAKLIEPLRLHWDGHSKAMGDFSWCGYDFVATPRVRDYLKSNSFLCEYRTVIIVPPGKMPKKYLKQMPDYKGDLFWVLATELISLNEKKSKIGIEIDCSVCGETHYEFRRTDLVIDRENWNGQKMFMIRQFESSSATFIVEPALHELLEQGFTNLIYDEAGVIK